MLCFLWLRKKDLNPHKQSQSLSCYHYTIPQYSVWFAYTALKVLYNSITAGAFCQVVKNIFCALSPCAPPSRERRRPGRTPQRARNGGTVRAQRDSSR